MESLLFGKPCGSVKIGLVGWGCSNRGVYETLLARGCRNFTVRAKSPAVLEGCACARAVFGDGYLDGLSEDVLFLSPSVRADAPVFADFSAKGGDISSDVRFFFGETRGKVFAVTGSDGKSTTVTLAHLLLKSGDAAAKIGGNIGAALSPFLAEDGERSLYAVELSSFQLMDFRPRVKRALVTCVSPNHLDFHKNFDEYLAAKANIYENCDEPILNADDACCLTVLKKKPFAVFSAKMTPREMAKTGAQICASFGEEGVFLNEKLILKRSDIRQAGAHAVQNAAAAVCLAYGYFDGAELPALFRGFRGLPHRMQTVRVKDGITYVDSSVDSSPARTATTLRALGGPCTVLLGGRGKGVPFDGLLPVLRDCAVGAVLMGETGKEMAALLQKHRDFLPADFRFCSAQSMKEAVCIASKWALSGGYVVLSPASTSFDAYRNFEERGADFQNEVNKK